MFIGSLQTRLIIIHRIIKILFDFKKLTLTSLEQRSSPPKKLNRLTFSISQVKFMLMFFSYPLLFDLLCGITNSHTDYPLYLVYDKKYRSRQTFNKIYHFDGYFPFYYTDRCHHSACATKEHLKRCFSLRKKKILSQENVWLFREYLFPPFYFLLLRDYTIQGTETRCGVENMNIYFENKFVLLYNKFK